MKWWIDGGRPVRLFWPGVNISNGIKEAAILLLIGRYVLHKVEDKMHQKKENSAYARTARASSRAQTALQEGP